MDKKTTDDTDKRVLSQVEKTSETSRAASNDVVSESSTRHLAEMRSTDVSSQGFMNAIAMPQQMPWWQEMNPSIHNQAVPRHKMMPSCFPAAASLFSGAGRNEQSAALIPGFISPSLTGSVREATTGYMNLAALLRTQEAMRSERDRQGGVVMRTSVAASCPPSSSSDQETLRDSRQMATQQQQMIDPHMLASMALANSCMQLQLSLGATLPGAHTTNNFQSALQAALPGGVNPTFFPQEGVSNMPWAPFIHDGLPPNIAGHGQRLPFGGARLPTPQSQPTSINLNVPDASHCATLRGGSTSRFSFDQRPSETHSALTGVTRGILEPFPERLHRLLLEVDAAGLHHIISFTEDGQAFKIHNPEELLKKILQVYFRQTRLSSFKRQLNLCKLFMLCTINYLIFDAFLTPLVDGFELIDHGKSKGGYYHEMFMRDEPGLARQIRRIDSKYGEQDNNKKKKAKKARYSTSAPDFYSMPPVLSNEEAEKKQAAKCRSAEEAREDSDSNSSSNQNPKKRKSSDEDEPERKPSPKESVT